MNKIKIFALTLGLALTTSAMADVWVQYKFSMDEVKSHVCDPAVHITDIEAWKQEVLKADKFGWEKGLLNEAVRDHRLTPLEAYDICIKDPKSFPRITKRSLEVFDHFWHNVH